MKSYLKYILAFVFLILLCVGFYNCTHMYYVANSHNVPMLKEQGDLQAGANVFAALESEGYNFHGAYAVTDKWAVNLNAIYGYGDYSDQHGEGYFTEAGAGYFKKLNEFFIFETYADVGFGQVKNDYGNGMGSSNLGFSRHSLQPSIGFASKYFDAALSLRTAGLYYYRIGTYAIQNSRDFDDVQFIRENPFSVYLEPAITLRGGVDPVKFQIQYVVSWNLNHPEINHEPFSFNFGLELNLFNLLKAQTPKTR